MITDERIKELKALAAQNVEEVPEQIYWWIKGTALPQLIEALAQSQDMLRVCREALEWEQKRCGVLTGPLKNALEGIKGL